MQIIIIFTSKENKLLQFTFSETVKKQQKLLFFINNTQTIAILFLHVQNRVTNAQTLLNPLCNGTWRQQPYKETEWASSSWHCNENTCWFMNMSKGHGLKKIQK